MSEDTVWSRSGGGERGVSEDTVCRQSGGGGGEGGCMRTLCGVNQVEGRGGWVFEDTVWSQSGGGERGVGV